MSEESAPEQSKTDSDGGRDEVKRRFREILDRKNARSRDGEDHTDGSSKVDNTHGPAGNRRTFRRKSG
ncbi:MAG: DUF5302 domain-containing protein [Micromonosporaceae bacterium]